MKDCFLTVLSSHGDEGCVFGADGKPVWLSRIFRSLDNDYMEKKAKVFLVQVGNSRRSLSCHSLPQLLTYTLSSTWM